MGWEFGGSMRRHETQHAGEQRRIVEPECWRTFGKVSRFSLSQLDKTNLESSFFDMLTLVPPLRRLAALPKKPVRLE